MKGERRKCAACKKRRLIGQHGLCGPCSQEPLTNKAREIIRTKQQGTKP